MRRAVAIALAVLLAIVPAVRAQDDPRAFPFVNRILAVVTPLILAPGDSGSFRLNLTNPYGHPMQNATLNVSVYEYATVETAAPVDASWSHEYPLLQARQADGTMCRARECRLMSGLPQNILLAGESLLLNFTVLTSYDMPHGSLFAEAAFFLRFWLEFDFNNGTAQSHLRMVSRGYFTSAQWDDARTHLGPGCTPYNPADRCIGSLNLTRLGVDGIIPDASFGVREGFPLWPFYGLLVLIVFFLALAFLFWVEENPGKYPRIERGWLRFKGRLRRAARRPGAGKF